VVCVFFFINKCVRDIFEFQLGGAEFYYVPDVVVILIRQIHIQYIVNKAHLVA
jgi:hypothetical protein